MDKGIQVAQDRKNASIAFFSATNNATAIYAALPAAQKKGKALDMIRTLRDELISDYNDYYSAILSNVGKSVDKSEIDELSSRVSSSKDIKSLQKIWMSLRQELRDNNSVRELFNNKKGQLKDNG